MSKMINIAVVGATGNVGRKVLEILKERSFPVRNAYALASRGSVGKKVSFGEDEVLPIETLENFDFSKTDIVFSCVNSDVTESYYKNAIKAGATIIDKSSLFRQDPEIPLIVPEVNSHILSELPKSRIISSPNCCVIPLVTALSPLDHAAKIKRIIVSTYQSVSGAGKEYMDDLYNQTKSSFLFHEPIEGKFERKIAFNLIPKIDDFNANGDSLEEEKICQETVKILGRHLAISVTSVRVPVFIGHSLSVNIEFENHLSATEAEEILSEAEGVVVLEQESNMQYITPVEVVGDDSVYVCRIRNDPSRNNCLNLWIVSDNLRKGAATNAVQIAESILKLIQ